MWAYPSTKSRAETEHWVRWAESSYADNGFGLWAVVRKSDGRLLGDCGPMMQPVEGQQVPELGWHILALSGAAVSPQKPAAPRATGLRQHRPRPTCIDRMAAQRCVPTGRREGSRAHARVHLGEVGTIECLFETLRSDLPELQAR